LLEAIPKYEWNSIPKNKQITSYTFTEENLGVIFFGQK